MEIIDLIPYGRENAIDRHRLTDLMLNQGVISRDRRDANRVMQLWLHELRKSNVIISTGSGYFRPTVEEIGEVGSYIKREENRLKEINTNLIYARKLYEDMKAGRV